MQPSGNKKEGKSKGKGKRKEISATCSNEHNMVFPQENDGLTAEELVMTSTGCKVQMCTVCVHL